MLHLAHIHEQKKNRIIQRNATQRNAKKRSDIEMVVTNQPNPLSRPVDANGWILFRKGRLWIVKSLDETGKARYCTLLLNQSKLWLQRLGGGCVQFWFMDLCSLVLLVSVLSNYHVSRVGKERRFVLLETWLCVICGKSLRRHHIPPTVSIRIAIISPSTGLLLLVE